MVKGQGKGQEQEQEQGQLIPVLRTEACPAVAVQVGFAVAFAGRKEGWRIHEVASHLTDLESPVGTKTQTGSLRAACIEDPQMGLWSALVVEQSRELVGWR
jgi:hypothetical protein